VDGAILWPNSVNTAQIGSTPNRSLCFVMKVASAAVEGPAPSRKEADAFGRFAGDVEHGTIGDHVGSSSWARDLV
jgi:hypothetical protein